MGVHVGGGGLQSSAYAKTAGQSGWCPMSQGRSVPMVGDSGARKPEKERFGLRAIILGQEHPQFGKMRLQPDLEPAPFFRILLDVYSSRAGRAEPD